MPTARRINNSSEAMAAPEFPVVHQGAMPDPMISRARAVVGPADDSSR